MRFQFSKKSFTSSIFVIVTIVALIASAYLLQTSTQMTDKGAIAWVASFDFQRDPASYDYIMIQVKNLGSEPVAICFAIFDVTGNLWKSALKGEGSAAWTMTGCSDSGGSDPWETDGAVGSLKMWTIRFQPVLPFASAQTPWLRQGTVIVYSKDSVTLIAPTAVMTWIGRSRTVTLQWLPAENISVIIDTISRPLIAVSNVACICSPSLQGTLVSQLKPLEQHSQTARPREELTRKANVGKEFG
ncbi:MAG: hypothetical protein ACLPY5_10430 [Candidatus Bathyarchaeia archaeon]